MPYCACGTAWRKRHEPNAEPPQVGEYPLGGQVRSTVGADMSFATHAIHAACTAQATIATPLGNVLLARTSRGLAGAWFEGQKDHPGELAAPERPGAPVLHA